MLLTLLVVGLLLGMVLSLVVYSRMELRRVRHRQELMQARSNAKLALLLALNQLQRHAGADQRVTARADLIGTPAGDAKFWTGVWVNNLTGGVNANPVWLVSGDTPDPASGGGVGSVLLFPAVNGDAAVRAPRVALTGPGGTPAGDLAFWVSDEASKASVQARRGAVAAHAIPPLLADRHAVEYQTDFGVDLDPLFQSLTFDIGNPAFANRLARVSETSILPLVTDSADVPLSPRLSDLPLHDLTLRALGVLENARDGGLKRNLSDLTYRDSFLATNETARFLGPKTNGVLQVETGLPSDRGVSPGQPYFSPRPLLTEAVLYMGLFHTWSDAKLRIRYHVQAEFLNPYSLALVFPEDKERPDVTRALTLVFENLPTITVSDTTAATTTPPITENLNELSYASATSPLRYINSWFEIAPDGTPRVPQLQPGETFQVMEPEPISQPRGLARDFGSIRWSTAAGTKPSDSAIIRIVATHPPGGVRIKAVPIVPSSPPQILRNLDPYFSWSSLQFDNFTIEKPFNSGPNPFSRPTSSSYVFDDYIFAYHFRLLSDETDPTSLRDLLSGAYVLDPDQDATRTFTDAAAVSRTHGELLDPISSHPPSIVSDTLNLFSDLDLIMDKTARSHAPDFRKMLLLDVPNNDTLTVGRLSSLPIYRQPLRVIGSPRGADYNAAFDLYYFSPKRTGTVPLVSPALLALDTPGTAAAHGDADGEMIDGAFNLNSTSVPAWEAVLSGPVLTPTALDETSGPDVTRVGAFFRLPGHQAADPDYVITPAEIKAPDAAFAQGTRVLEPSLARAQLRQIAEGIVQRLKSRATPFPDLQSFVSSGILQESIDAVPGINQDLFAQSNVYLLQQDLLKKLAPVLTPRSDTFVIRAYGDIPGVNASTPRSRAWCEAVVQRMPRKLDGSDPLTPAGNLLDARAFEIVSFRWLTDEDL